MNKLSTAKVSGIIAFWVGVLCAVVASTHARAAGECIDFSNRAFVGKLCENGDPTAWQNPGSPQNGLKDLKWKGISKSLFLPVGFYFEHIFNGTVRDKDKALYAPHRSLCHAERLGEDKYRMIWRAQENPWNMDCVETFTFDESAIEMHFEVVLNSESCAPLGWISFMWASYVGGLAVERNIRFLGIEGGEIDRPISMSWTNFGREDAPVKTESGFKLGTRVGSIRYLATAERRPEEGAPTMNVFDSSFLFTHPFYFGFLDADGDFATESDTVVYVMMFDRADGIRLMEFDPNASTHSPAWDWQFDLRNPEVGQKYQYRARMLLIPLAEILGPTVGREEVVSNPPERLCLWVKAEWQKWLKGLPEPAPNANPAIFFADQDIERSEYILWPRNKPFTPPIVVAGDDMEGDLTAKIVVDDSQIRLNELGKCPIRYSVEDSMGASCERILTVEIVDCLRIANDTFSGQLCQNCDPETWTYGGSPQNGFRDLVWRGISRNLFNPAGFYFEHIFNGAKADETRSAYAPHRSPCHIEQLAQDKCRITWKASENPWNMDCVETFTLGVATVDMDFEVVLNSKDCAPLGWVSFMWASYINGLAAERNIHFFGVEGGRWEDPNVLRWANFGREDAPAVTPGDDKLYARVGPIRYIGSPERRAEPGINTLNVSDTDFRFAKPFYYGFLDSDGDFATESDTVVYLMMFDRAEEIRLAAFDPKASTHSPAWDWQFVLSSPETCRKYEYHARLLLTPLAEILGSGAVRREVMTNPPPALNGWAEQQWNDWLKTFPEPAPNGKPGILLADRRMEYSGVTLWPQSKPFVPPAAIAADDRDGDLASSLTVDTSGVRAGETGVFSVLYRAKDSEGAAFERTLAVEVKESKPRLSFLATNPMPWPKGKPFVLPPMTAGSDLEGDLSGKIRVIRNTVSPAQLGMYEVAASVESAVGDVTEALLRVSVEEQVPPITFECANPLPWRKGTPFVMPKVNIWNDYTYDLEKDCEIKVLSNNLDVNRTGVYQIVVQGRDSKGRVSETTLIVEVKPGLLFDALQWLR